ncbi:PfkB family carbohydrate kinase [Clostridium omnivorum]|uniref:Carbohydrate kinase n=1 Tax=Clostridium omnivorum TaxID=1604902 RepID=A0ABQ5NAA4_9CLOT|nr:PfkB family carbohydrate kinase [Clostridium sp. E14]GLC32031.1 carbohydrate kinase [Clostridium sp. E14]
MTNREKEILKLLRKNPMISQNELADMLGIARSSAAVHITNLIKKGYILGKGYILNEEDYVTVIGGVNIDMVGFPEKQLIVHDSNPGKVKISLGGVGRNIAENLVRLGLHTKLISVVGDDVYGAKVIEEARNLGLDMKDSLVLKGQQTSTYMAILDEKGDMSVAIAYMDIYDNLSVDFIKEKKHVVENSRLCIIDTNIPKDVIEYTVTTNKKTDFFLDTVSTTKAMKVKNLIGYFHTIKPNKIEAEMLSGIEINTEEDLKRASYYFLNKGVKRVFISLGEQGVYYDDGTDSRQIKTPKINVVNATGAGDAFIAALAYSHYSDFDIDYSTRFAIGASVLALSHEETINPNMSVENITNRIKELNLI